MKLDDSALERICEYASICSQSNYGNKEECTYKEDCKLYWKNVDAEMRLWTWWNFEHEEPFEEDEDDV